MKDEVECGAALHGQRDHSLNRMAGSAPLAQSLYRAASSTQFSAYHKINAAAASVHSLRARAHPSQFTPSYFCAAGASGCPGNCLLAGSMWSQARALRVQMWVVIFMSSPPSRVPARTTRMSGVVARCE